MNTNFTWITMTNTTNPKADIYFLKGCMRCDFGGTLNCKVHKWTNELIELRKIVLECGLKEELKWGVPCYTFQGKNILILSALKNHCSLGFFKGALLKDPNEILKEPGENSQAVRQFRITSVQEIFELEATIKSYIMEAIEIEKVGLKIDFKAKKELKYPAELLQKMNEMPALKTAFEKLTLGRQRGYILHFSSPKRSVTRTSRIEKLTSKILEGKGFHDL